MYYFIINPQSKSGKGLKIWRRVRAELDRQDLSYAFCYSCQPFHAAELAEKICTKDSTPKCIVVLGGDGTFNEVLNGIENQGNVCLGYIPTGSGNDLAKALSIPLNPVQALRNILKCTEPITFDSGIVSLCSVGLPRFFAISTGIGFDASICREAMDSKLKFVLNRIGLGKLTYLAIALKQLMAFKTFDACVTADGHKKTFKDIFFIAAMNQPYEGGGFLMAPQADAGDGQLSVAIFYNMSRLKALSILPRIHSGAHLKSGSVKTFNCASLSIQTSSDQVVHTDGEYSGSASRITAQCIPQDIKMRL